MNELIRVEENVLIIAENAIEQIKGFENKRKFDIVAAMQMALIGDEALTGINPTSIKTLKSQ